MNNQALLNNIQELMEGNRPFFTVFRIPPAGRKNLRKYPETLYYVLIQAIYEYENRKHSKEELDEFIKSFIPIPYETLQHSRFGLLCSLFYNENFSLKPKIYKKLDTCSICFEDGEQEFVQTKCGHLICSRCFVEM